MKLINREGIPSLDSYIELIKEEISVNKIKKNSILFKKMCSKFFKKISKNEDKLEGENFIQGKSIEDYYTDLYQEFVRSGGVSEDEERYRKVVTVQNSKYKDQFEILGLEETFAVLSKHIEVYMKRIVCQNQLLLILNGIHYLIVFLSFLKVKKLQIYIINQWEYILDLLWLEF